MNARPILCATDFSPHGDQAVELAARLARALRTPLTLLHVLTSTSIDVERAQVRDEPGLADAREEAARHALDHQARRADAQSARRIVSIGEPAEVVASLASSLDARLIVVGARATNHAPAMCDVVLGSTAEQIVRSARRPVLVACQTSTPSSLDAWIVGVEIEPVSLHALDVAMELSERARGHLSAVHVVESDDVDEREVNRRLDHEVADAVRRAPPHSEPSTWLLRGRPADVLTSMAKDLNGILVIGTHAPGVLARSMLGHVASSVLRRAQTPVLLVPALAPETGAPS